MVRATHAQMRDRANNLCSSVFEIKNGTIDQNVMFRNIYANKIK